MAAAMRPYEAVELASSPTSSLRYSDRPKIRDDAMTVSRSGVRATGGSARGVRGAATVRVGVATGTLVTGALTTPAGSADDGAAAMRAGPTDAGGAAAATTGSSTGATTDVADVAGVTGGAGAAGTVSTDGAGGVAAAATSAASAGAGPGTSTTVRSTARGRSPVRGTAGTAATA